MDEFPANSQKAKATDTPREKLNPVTSAEPVRRKRGLGRQFKETFFSGSAREAAEYMVVDIVVPAVRDMFADAMQSGIERLIYGDRTPGPSKGRSRSSIMSNPAGHVNYGGMTQSQTKQTQPQQKTLSRRSRARHNLDELVIQSRQESEEVIDQMFDVLSRYGVVSVADLYELTGIQSGHTDMKWGWTNLRGAKAVRLRQGGFLLDLPDPEPLT